MVDSGVIRNYISLKTIKRLRLLYRQKEDPYPLVTISRDPIAYKDGIIHFKTGPMELKLKGKRIVMLFNVLSLGKDKAILGMPFL